MKGNKNVDVDRPVPISNVCHVVQNTDGVNKSSYKCVRVEFLQTEEGKKVNLPI